MISLDAARPYLGLLKTGLFVACVAAAFAYGCSRGHDSGVADGEAKVRATELAKAKTDAKVAQDNQRAAEAQRDRYKLRAEAQEAVAGQYLEELINAQSKGDRLAADVRAGDVRFRKLWAQCQAVPATGHAATGTGAPDGATDDRAASAGRIVRAAAECDAQVRGLQALILSDRAMAP